MNSKAISIGMLVAACFIVGCTKRDHANETAFERDEDTEVVLVLAIDLSGSFKNLMTEDGQAYKFALNAIDRYFRANAASDNKVILAQISGTRHPLLWEGTARQLRRQFNTADSFRQFLIEKADDNGTRVAEGLANTFRYLTDHYAVKNGAKPIVLVLSDLMDTSENGGQQFDTDIDDTIRELASRDTVFGFYYVFQSAIDPWRTRLSNCGVRDFIVEGDVVRSPTLPAFE